MHVCILANAYAYIHARTHMCTHVSQSCDAGIDRGRCGGAAMGWCGKLHRMVWQGCNGIGPAEECCRECRETFVRPQDFVVGP